MINAGGITLSWQDDSGVPRGEFDLTTEVVSIDYVLSENAVGVAVIDFMPCEKADMVDEGDRFILHWSDGCGGASVVEGDTSWIVLKIRDSRNISGTFITVWVYTANVLLSMRSIPAYSETPQAKKTGPADDMIKELWDDNFSAAATEADDGQIVPAPDRDWSAYIDREQNNSDAPVVSRAMAWRKDVMAVMLEIAEDSTRLGVPLFFDIVYTAGKLRLITKTVARGLNRLFGQSANSLALSVDNGLLIQSTYTRNHRDEVTFAYAAGRGEERERLHASSDDPDRIAANVFGRKETVGDARNTHDPSILIDNARSTVVSGRPDRSLEVSPSPDFIRDYNVGWRWGDLVTITHGTRSFACAISKVSVKIEKNEVTVEPTFVERYGFTF